MSLTHQQKIEAQRMAEQALGISRNESRPYSISKAIRRAMDGLAPDGFEGECHQAMVRKYGETRTTGAFKVPTGIVVARDMTAATAANGGYIVGTDLRADLFIDMLRNRTVVGQMGATFLTGLVGNVAIPKQTASATAYWLTNEATDITESQPTLAQLSLTPKNVGAYTEVSRQLLLQATPNIDTLIMNDLARVLAVAIDKAALDGDGTGGAPTGISNTSGIGSVTGTSLAYAGLLQLQTDLGNALRQGAEVGYVSTPAVAALLSQRSKVASTYSPLWDGNVHDGTVCGFKAMSSNQMTAGSMVFADWSQLLIGEWGSLEIAVNPFANFTAGITGIRAIQTVDVAVRQASAFSRATSIT